MRREEKSEYLNVVFELLGNPNQDLKFALGLIKTQNLLYLVKSLSDLLGRDMPQFPTRTRAQIARLSFLHKGNVDESNRISEPVGTSL
jgi:hypothetical protein